MRSGHELVAELRKMTEARKSKPFAGEGEPGGPFPPPATKNKPFAQLLAGYLQHLEEAHKLGIAIRWRITDKMLGPEAKSQDRTAMMTTGYQRNDEVLEHIKAARNALAVLQGALAKADA
jgi:hypothetical protein